MLHVGVRGSGDTVADSTAADESRSWWALLAHHVRYLGLTPTNGLSREAVRHRRGGWRNVVVFLLCIPAGYLLHNDGPFVLLLLAVPVQITELRRLDIRHIRHPVRE